VNTAAAARVQELRHSELDLLMQKLHTHAGIRIDSTNRVIAGTVQSRMTALGLGDVQEYLALFDDSLSARAEWLALIDLLTVKETRFFRQPDAYKCLARYVDELLDTGPAPSELSFWSAGCSHGQELYSMAMVVESAVARSKPWQQWHGIGTDISFNAVHHAQQARYPGETMKFIPLEYRQRFMREEQGGQYAVADAITARTHFFHSNLLHVDSAPFADFSIIFCQNTLIYFERERQRWIIDQLVKRLRGGGLLILGAGEDVSWLGQNVCRLQWPGVCAYKKTGG
jgi:type IV pilus assembly protein PilK